MSDRQRPVDKQASSSRDRVTDSTLGSSRGGSSGASAGVSTFRVAPIEAGFEIGRYRIERKLGDGGFGDVYLARDLELNRLVALKLLKTRSGVSSAQADKELLEARAAARLDHPAITPIYDVGRVSLDGSEEGCRYMVSKWIEGTDLAGLMQNQRSGERAVQRPGQRESAELIAAIADGLHYAHLQGLVHRDIKPANILIDKQRRPHLADFGLAVHEDELVSRAGEMSGTPCYMAPEQAAGRTQHLDGRADIWSLGVILYELLTGRRPFRGESVSQLFAEIRERPAKPPRQIDDTIPAELERIVLKCLAKNVGERYSTAKDLADDLRRYLESPAKHAPVAAAPVKQAQATFKLRGCLVTLTFSMAAVILAAILAAPYLGKMRNTAFVDFHHGEDAATGAVESNTESDPQDVKSVAVSPIDDADPSAVEPAAVNDAPENRVDPAIPFNIGETDPAIPAPPSPVLPDHVEPSRAIDDDNSPSENAFPENGFDGGAEDSRHLFRLGGRFLSLRGDRRDRAKRESLDRLAEVQAKQVANDAPQDREAVALALEDAADALAAEEEFAPAAEFLEQSLEMRRELHGEDSPKLTRVLNRLGEALIAVGKSSEAEELLHRALSIEDEHALPAEQAVTLKNLAQAAENLGQSESAETFRVRAEKIEAEIESESEVIEPPAPE